MSIFKKTLCFFIIIGISFIIDIFIRILYFSINNLEIFCYKYIGYSEDIIIFLFNIIFGLINILPLLYIVANELSGFKTFIIIRMDNNRFLLKKFISIILYNTLIIFGCLFFTHFSYGDLNMYKIIVFLFRNIAISILVVAIAYLTHSTEKAIIFYLAIAIITDFFKIFDINIVLIVSIITIFLGEILMVIAMNKYPTIKERM